MDPAPELTATGFLERYRCCLEIYSISLGWIFAFLVNASIGFALYCSDISLLSQFRNAALEVTAPDLSDFLLKFSVIYLLTRYQLSLKTFSDSPVGQCMAWIVSILVNLVVGDLLIVLIWRPFVALLTNVCIMLSTKIDQDLKPTYVMMGLSQWLKLMAANQLKFAVVFYLLFRCFKSLIQSPHSPVSKQPCIPPQLEPEVERVPRSRRTSTVNRRRSRSVRR